MFRMMRRVARRKKERMSGEGKENSFYDFPPRYSACIFSIISNQHYSTCLDEFCISSSPRSLVDSTPYHTLHIPLYATNSSPNVDGVNEIENWKNVIKLWYHRIEFELYWLWIFFMFSWEKKGMFTNYPKNSTFPAEIILVIFDMSRNISNFIAKSIVTVRWSDGFGI